MYFHLLQILQEVKAANVIVKKLNLASLSSVKQCALDVINTEAQLHLLINNAGILFEAAMLA